MLILHDVQFEKGISRGIGMTGADQQLSDKRTEQVSSLTDERLTVESKECFVAAKPTAVASGKNGSRQF